MQLLDLFAIPVASHPRKVALRSRDAEGGVVDWTYEALDARAAAMAAALAACGVARGDRVAFYLGNRPEFVSCYLAVLRLGAAMLPINLAYRRREIAHMLADAEPMLVVSEEALRGVFDELGPGELAGARLVTVEELAAAGAAGEPAPVRVDGGDLALLMYTSGTTGRSKGAMLSHDNVLATVTALLAAWGWSASDVLLLTLPLFHTHGLVVGLHCTLAAGATVRLRPRFDAAAVVDELLEGDTSLFFGVPTMYVRLVEELRRRGGPRLSRQRLFCSGSAALSPETFAGFAELSGGHRILERYGMTETGMLLSNPLAGPRLPGTVGTPLPGVSARIVDGGGGDVEPGAEGELLVRGGNVFRGYWRAPEKTAESFTIDAAGDRWFKTGDLARRDPETGAVALKGRRSELIISGGFNIYPREIEEVLEAFPGVREAAVVGRPHPEWGEVPEAYVVADEMLDETGLIAHCKAQLASFKAPKSLHRVDSLPRNALGKVQKHLLPR
jgi:malonyl-CoA/methylmalonyl-CoA synthetase